MHWFQILVVASVAWITLLALYVSFLRIKYQTANGDRGIKPLRDAIRAHANALEHTIPFALVVLVLAQSGASDSALLPWLVGSFLAARVGHAVAMVSKQIQLRRVSATIVYIAEAVAVGAAAMNLLA